MKKLVFFPSDPINAYIQKGRTYEYLEEYYNPGNYFDEVYCLSPWGEVEEEVIGKIHYIKAAPFKFAKIIKKIKPDIIRGYGGYCCADWVSYSKVKGIPTVVSVHDTNPATIYDSLKYADGIICMSQAVKDSVIKLVPDITKNIWIMPNRIDINLFSKKTDINFFQHLNKRFPGKKHILHVGRKTRQKNLDTVIKAMKYLDDDIVSIFIGLGDIDEYKNLATEEKVVDRCFFVDSVPNDELPLWYSWCDCMCTPSRWEGFGFVFIEAAACETCVVTSNIGPMNEYFTNGLNSILIDDYENPLILANAIQYALRDSKEIQEIRKKARDVGLKFQKDIIDQQEISIYETMFKIKPNNRINNSLKKKRFEAITRPVFLILKKIGLGELYKWVKFIINRSMILPLAITVI